MLQVAICAEGEAVHARPRATWITPILASIALSASPAQSADFTGVGFPGGGTKSTARAVSGDGRVVVGTSGTTGFALDWEKGSWTELSPWSNHPDGVSIPNAVNADGSLVVGRTYWEGNLFNPQNMPTGWDTWSSGDPRVVVMHWDPLPWTPYGAATAVTPDSSFVAGYEVVDYEYGWQYTVAFRQGPSEGFPPDPPDTIEITPTRCWRGLNDDSYGTQAFAMSADGQVIAIAEICYNRSFPEITYREYALWVDGSIVETPLYSVYALSADGSIAAGGGPAYAENGVVTDLGALPGGNGYGAAYAMSQDGSVIVGTANGPSGYEAFIWDAEHGIRSLRDVLIGLGVDMTGWQLDEAAGISYDGLVIVGNVTDPLSHTQGWVADFRPPPPEQLPSLAPGGAGILLAGLLGAGAAALRRRGL
jgi:uncharacterized membrane protein